MVGERGWTHAVISSARCRDGRWNLRRFLDPDPPPPDPTVLLSASSYFMHPHSSCIHAHMQTYKADFYNALYVPPGSKMLLTFAEILVTLRGCSVWSLTIVSVFCCFSMPCCPVGKPATRLSRVSKQMKVIIIWAAFHLFVSLKCWLKRFAGGLMWIQRLALHLVIMTKIFSVITLTQNAIKGAWKGLRRCYIKKTSLNHPKLYSMFAILQCHDLKVLWWSQSLKIFMRLSSSSDEFKLRRAAAFAVVFCACLPSVQTVCSFVFVHYV